MTTTLYTGKSLLSRSPISLVCIDGTYAVKTTDGVRKFESRGKAFRYFQKLTTLTAR